MGKSTSYKILRHQISGLKCDAPGCGYTDASVSVVEYPKWVNAPCPSCGAPLLTEADYRAVLRHMAAAIKINEWANRWLPEWLLRRWDISQPDRKAGAVVYGEMNGTGTTKFRRTPPDAR
ncbi:hypothetical protein J2847_005810 [Azospirillum agricola]|uniref:hypothetical protein n=1 Tax=Azospirillum agricola TaxID=1720247 RepID=UPI001AE13E99|nr:hypothetical protein [Azospirillum agricola]MBP2232481.1 hypothetical protein [Azospirillum agricola]